MIKNNSIRKLKRDVEAVSPVIATVLLVLVAVASAVAFYAVMNIWQEDQSAKLGGVDIDQKKYGSISVAGSTTVQPMMDLAAANFMKINPEVKISVQGGGSSAGITAAKTGTADIGMISKAWTEGKDFPGIVATTIAYDGVVVVFSENNDFITEDDELKMTKAILQKVYGVKVVDNKIESDAANQIKYWQDLKAQLNPTYAATIYNAETLPTGYTGMPDSAKTAIVLYDRSEESGTEEGFVQKLLGASDSKAITTANGVKGNDGMIAALNSNENGIGFTSYGMAASSSSDLKSFWFSTTTAANAVECTPANVVAELNSKGAGYAGSRPLVVLTNGAPVGIVADFLNYITEESNNKALCAAEGYISLYAVA